MDKNRDRLIEFYLVLVGALLASLTTARLDPLSGSILCLVIFLLGLALAHTVTQYRLWHTRYSHTGRLLEAFARSDNPTDAEKRMRRLSQRELGIYSGWESNKEDKKRGLWAWLWHETWQVPGTESATFQASLLIAAIPLYLFIGKMPQYPLAISAGAVLLYILTANFLAAWYLYKQHLKCPWATWLLDGLDQHWDFCNQKQRDWPNM
jgi:hypothetical protein